MKNNFNDIDNFLRDSFEDFASEPAPEFRTKVSASVRKFNFFKFNPMSFNIFYLVAIIVGTGTIVSFATTDNDTYIAKSLVYPIENIFITTLPRNEILHNELATNAINPEFEVKKQNDFTFNNPSSDSQKHIVSNAIQNNVTTNNHNISIITEDKTSSSLNYKSTNFEISAPVEKNIIFDTIIEEKNSTILDTINVEVRKTVEIKKKRKSLK